mmetsp:Transcript_14740/g.28537  ORF Transcript_14740/g.28537 Transcript_14740/m.28537 type:complete len:218 (+) Transcript_14740:125-778(+)
MRLLSHGHTKSFFLSFDRSGVVFMVCLSQLLDPPKTGLMEWMIPIDRNHDERFSIALHTKLTEFSRFLLDASFVNHLIVFLLTELYSERDDRCILQDCNICKSSSMQSSASSSKIDLTSFTRSSLSTPFLNKSSKCCTSFGSGSPRYFSICPHTTFLLSSSISSSFSLLSLASFALSSLLSSIFPFSTPSATSLLTSFLSSFGKSFSMSFWASALLP